MGALAKLSAEDYLEGQIIFIDKPLGWTSFDVVKKVKNLLRQRYDLKKIKVGHAGTLDPLATGLLVICTGKFTKRITALTLEDKGYTGTILLGSTTPSYDLETPVGNHLPTAHITSDMVESAVAKMRGAQMQMPPQYSAKQVDGKRAYDTARQGGTTVLEARPINISEFSVDTNRLPEISFSINCSKGTYIRSIAHDLGESLGCGAHLTGLVRTSVGSFALGSAMGLEEFETSLQVN